MKTIMARRASIIHLVTLSRPPCTPREHTVKPMITTMTMKPTVTTESPDMDAKNSDTPDASRPVNPPVTDETAYLRIHPVITV